MGFSEQVKLEAKQRSQFQCAACRDAFVEVHHILPEGQGGPDTIDNACPLCARCHDLVGGNPDKRKQIREMRDFQWELNEKRSVNPASTALNEKLDSLQHALTQTASGQAVVLEEMKKQLTEFNIAQNKALSQVSNLQQFVAVTGLAPGGPPRWG